MFHRFTGREEFCPRMDNTHDLTQTEFDDEIWRMGFWTLCWCCDGLRLLEMLGFSKCILHKSLAARGQTVEGWIMAPKDAHVPIPGAWEHVTLHGKTDCEDVVKTRLLGWGSSPASSQWTRCTHSIPGSERTSTRAVLHETLPATGSDDGEGPMSQWEWVASR